MTFAESELSKSAPESMAPVSPSPDEVIVSMELEIPSIGLSCMVVPGTSKEALSAGPGWYEGSARPGEGNTAIAGHEHLWFKKLRTLKPGDEIVLTCNGKKYIYIVESVFPIAVNDWSVIAPTESPVLTLTTCLDKTHRLACRAVMVS
ncbi:MAG TPA: sortase [Terriglobales bacterium]|nr:sortase [Terriglobales bacterium]